MKINRLLLKPNTPTIVEEEIIFPEAIDANHVKRIPSCKVKATLTDFDDVLLADLEINAEVIASCAYTLEDVPLTKKLKERLSFTSIEEMSDEDLYFEPNNEIDLDPYIFSFIIASVPHNVHKKGAKLPEPGNGYRVISEEEYLKEQQTKKHSSPFDALDDLDLD